MIFDGYLFIFLMKSLNFSEKRMKIFKENIAKRGGDVFDIEKYNYLYFMYFIRYLETYTEESILEN